MAQRGGRESGLDPRQRRNEDGVAPGRALADVRALLIILDSVGVGNAPDAEQYGDTGANTLEHIFEQVPDLKLPTLDSLGLSKIRGRANDAAPRASYGKMRERSAGKD